MNAIGIDVSKGKIMMAVMEATGRYHEPVAAALHEYGIRVTVISPLFIKQSGGGSIRKVKDRQSRRYENRQVRS